MTMSKNASCCLGISGVRFWRGFMYDIGQKQSVKIVHNDYFTISICITLTKDNGQGIGVVVQICFLGIAKPPASNMASAGKESRK